MTQNDGHRNRIDVIFSLAYEELRQSAARLRRREWRETVTTTALVHESWFKLRHSPELADLDPDHFKWIVIRAMRQVLVEEARRQAARKRDGELMPLTSEPAAAQYFSSYTGFLNMNEALDELEHNSSRQAEVVCRRVFGGQTIEEIAAALQISKATVERDWRIARAWLAVRMRAQNRER